MRSIITSILRNVESLALKANYNAIYEEESAIKYSYTMELREFYASHAKTELNIKSHGVWNVKS